MFLTLEKFLQHFPNIKISKKEFCKKFKIMYKTPMVLNDIFDLKKSYIIKSNEDFRYIHKNDVIDYFYDIIIENRHKYLTLWFNAHFKFKNPDELIWDNFDLLMPNKIDNNSIISIQKNDKSKHIIRNLFYLELFDYTKITNTIKNNVSFWKSLTNMYNK